MWPWSSTEEKEERQRRKKREREEREEGEREEKQRRMQREREERETELRKAADEGDVSTVRELLETRNMDVDTRDSFGWSPLHYASFEGHAAVVELLLKANASVDAADEDGSTPLHNASFEGHAAVVELLLKANASVDAADEIGTTPLHNASFEGHTAVVELLVTANASVDAAEQDGSTPLHNASSRRRAEVVELLLKAKATVDVTNKEGETPLHKACERHCPDVARLLLQSGANLGAKDKDGFTPLHNLIRAREYASVDSETLHTLQVLVLYGAAWNTKCDEIVAAGHAWDEASSLALCVQVWIQEFADGLRFSNIPIEVVKRGVESTQAYIDSLKSSREVVLRRKICVVGPSFWGKTSLVKSISERKPSLEHPDDRTIGIDQFPISFSDTSSNAEGTSMEANEEAKCQQPGGYHELSAEVSQPTPERAINHHHEVTFWDFAGQEAYQVAHSAYFSKRTLYLICVDLRAYAVALEQAELRADKNSDVERLMNEFVDSKVLRWIRLVLASQPDAEFVFAGTKSDVLERTRYRIDKARKDLKKRTCAFAEKIESKSRDPDERLGRLHRHAGPNPMDDICSQELDASAKRLCHLQWLTVNCKDSKSVKTARKAIEQIIIKSKRSFQTPELYSQVLTVISERRVHLQAKRPSSQVTESFLETSEVCSILRNELPKKASELPNRVCREILRTLHDIGDVLWFEDLSIAYLKDRVILHPLVLIEFVRQVVHHNHNSEVVTHAALKERPFWDDFGPELMLVMKQLLEQFHLVHPTRSKMEWDSDLIVPAFWRSKESALWLFLGDLLVNKPDLETMKKDFQVQWEYHFTTSLPDVLFDELVIESYMCQYERHTGPDWIMYTVGDQFVCRVVVTRAPKTMERVLRVEAVASKATTAAMWGRFEHLCESLERVLSRYKGLLVTRCVIDDKNRAHKLETVVDEWMRMPKRRREFKSWLPPKLDWYYNSVMKARADAHISAASA